MHIIKNANGPADSSKVVQICNSKWHQQGFSMLEMLITVGLMSILVGIAVPSSTALYDSYNKQTAELQVLVDLRKAQATTVQEGCQGVFSIASDKMSYTYGCDYAPFSGTNPPTIETTFFTRYMPKNITLSADSFVIFNSRGQVTDYIGTLDTRTISLSLNINGTATQYSSGSLRPTGFFRFDP